MLLTLIPASCILSVCAARYSEIYFVTVVCGNYNKYGPGRWTDARERGMVGGNGQRK